MPLLLDGGYGIRQLSLLVMGTVLCLHGSRLHLVLDDGYGIRQLSLLVMGTVLCLHGRSLHL